MRAKQNLRFGKAATAARVEALKLNPRMPGVDAAFADTDRRPRCTAI
jgi:hypothetical protein